MQHPNAGQNIQHQFGGIDGWETDIQDKDVVPSPQLGRPQLTILKFKNLDHLIKIHLNISLNLSITLFY